MNSAAQTSSQFTSHEVSNLNHFSHNSIWEESTRALPFLGLLEGSPQGTEAEYRHFGIRSTYGHLQSLS